jgi:hypothetical protein
MILIPAGPAFDISVSGAFRGPSGGNIGVFGRLQLDHKK